MEKNDIFAKKNNIFRKKNIFFFNMSVLRKYDSDKPNTETLQVFKRSQ